MRSKQILFLFLETTRDATPHSRQGIAESHIYEKHTHAHGRTGLLSRTRHASTSGCFDHMWTIVSLKFTRKLRNCTVYIKGSVQVASCGKPYGMSACSGPKLSCVVHHNFLTIPDTVDVPDDCFFLLLRIRRGSEVILGKVRRPLPLRRWLLIGLVFL